MTGLNVQRTAIVDLHRCGQSNSDIAKRLAVYRNVIFRAMKRYGELDSLYDSPKTGLLRSSRIPVTIKAVRDRIRRNLKRSISTTAQELGIFRYSAQTIPKDDLNMRQYSTRDGDFLSTRNKAKRVEGCQELLRGTVALGAYEIIFSDEKLFIIEEVYNSQNVRGVARDPEAADRNEKSLIEPSIRPRLSFG